MRYRYWAETIPFDELKQGDYINIYSIFTITLNDVPFQMELNINFVILHGKFVSVYYGMLNEEDVNHIGKKVLDESVLDLIPELKQHGYRLYL